MVGEAVAAVARGLFLLALLLVVLVSVASIAPPRVILAVLAVLVRVRFRIRVRALVVEVANAFAGFLASADVHVPQTRARVVVLGGVRGRPLLPILLQI